MRFPVLLLLFGSAVAPRLVAQAPAASPPTDAYAAVRTSLRNLIVAEERYYSDHGSYTTDLAALGIPMPKTHADAVMQGYSIAVVQAGGRGWWGQGQLRGAGEKGCVVFVGELKYIATTPTTPTGKAASADDEGRAVCDLP